MLSPQETAFFAENGYLIKSQLASTKTIQLMREQVQHDLDEMIEPIEYEADVKYPGSPDNREVTGGKTVRRLKNALVRHPVFLEWMSEAGLMSYLSCLLPAPIYCPMAHHNCVMTKQPLLQQ